MEYNKNMRKWQPLVAFLIILIPLALGVSGQPLPIPLEHSRALVKLQQARKTGDSGVEMSAIESILTFTPWRGELWQRAGRLYLDTGQVERAILAFDQSDELGELDGQGKIWQVDALIAAGRMDDAREVVKSAHLEDPFLLTQAVALLRKAGELEGAREVLIDINRLDPDNDEVNYQIGVLSIVEEPDLAQQAFQMVQADVQQQANARYLLEVIYSRSDNENPADWRLIAGQALSQVGEWDAAQQAFQSVVNDDPTHARALALLGESQQQNQEDGQASLEKAFALNPDDELVNALLGLYYRRQGNTEQALVYLERALKINPLAAVWRMEMGGALADAGRLEEGLAQYQAAVDIDRSDPESWYALAKFSISRNYQVEESGLGAARQAVVLAPNNPVYLDLLGTGYMTLGDLDNAERSFLQALQLDPEQAAILIHLGQVSYSRGQKEDAFAYWRRASVSARSDRLKEMAERLLQENNGRGD